MNNNNTDVTTWMPLYVSDFLVATMGWPAEAVGHYTRMLFLQWDRGGLPSAIEDWECLSAGISKYKNHLLPKFPLGSDGLRYNKRCEEERSKAAHLRIKRSEAGRKGAKKRWEEGDPERPEGENLTADSSAVPPTSAPVVDRGARDALKAYNFAPIHRQQGWKLFLREWEYHVVRQHLDVARVLDMFEKYYKSPAGRGKFCRSPKSLVEGGVWDEDCKAWEDPDHDISGSLAALDKIVGGE